jgi:hypothetical protein
MTFCSWLKNIFCCKYCCKPKSILDLKNDQYNSMADSNVIVTFNTGSPKGSDDNKRYSLSDDFTYNDIYR